jgi:hypothetical protein
MTSANNFADRPGTTPIYDSLIQEHGDVVAEARQVVEQAQRDAPEAPAEDRAQETHGTSTEG